ncbi:uncharacterized protein METZ01_LOCUS334681, partial [marine metagenome]
VNRVQTAGPASLPHLVIGEKLLQRVDDGRDIMGIDGITTRRFLYDLPPQRHMTAQDGHAGEHVFEEFGG